MKRVVSFAICVALSATGSARADDFVPVVSFSVHDEPLDGAGDSFNASPFTGLLRSQATRADRAMQEFNVTSVAGQNVAAASIRGQIANNNAGGTFPRVFRFELYAADGVASVADYGGPGIVLGTASWPAPTPPLDFTFDAASALRTLISGGASFVGLRVIGTSDNLFPSILIEGGAAGTVLSVTAGAPNCVADVDDGTGTGTRDGGVTIDDLLFYLALYAAGDIRGDVDNGSGTGTPDGGVTIDDLLYFLARYAAGC